MSVCLFLLKCHFLANCPESYLNTFKLLRISPCILYYFMLNKDRLVVTLWEVLERWQNFWFSPLIIPKWELSDHLVLSSNSVSKHNKFTINMSLFEFSLAPSTTSASPDLAFWKLYRDFGTAASSLVCKSLRKNYCIQSQLTLRFLQYVQMTSGFNILICLFSSRHAANAKVVKAKQWFI